MEYKGRHGDPPGNSGGEPEEVWVEVDPHADELERDLWRPAREMTHGLVEMEQTEHVLSERRDGETIERDERTTKSRKRYAFGFEPKSGGAQHDDLLGRWKQHLISAAAFIATYAGVSRFVGHELGNLPTMVGAHPGTTGAFLASAIAVAVHFSLRRK